MLYHAYEARRRLSAPVFGVAALQSAMLRSLPQPPADSPYIRALRAAPETVAALELTHGRPGFGIESVDVDGELVRVREEIVTATAFGTLWRFAKASDAVQPRVLVIPGLAGHFATLIRGTMRTLLPDHDVFVADWHNARDVPPARGRSVSLERTVITTVPWPHGGAGRRVYPGFLQAMGFVSMSPKRRVSAFTGLARDIAKGHDAAARRTTDFYDEYFAVLDALCVGIPTERRRHHLQSGVGHYGVFSGTRFGREIYPEIRSFVAENERLTP